MGGISSLTFHLNSFLGLIVSSQFDNTGKPPCHESDDKVEMKNHSNMGSLVELPMPLSLLAATFNHVITLSRSASVLLLTYEYIVQVLRTQRSEP